MATSRRQARREEILDAAQRLTEREGLEHLTMRRLCAEMGLSAPILYRHFANKAELESGLVMRLLATEALPSSEGVAVGTWLRDTFLLTRQMQLAHPGLVARMANSEILLENALRMSETVLGVLAEAGVPPARAGAVFQSLMAYTVGSAAMAGGTQSSNEALAGKLMAFPRVLAAGLTLDPRPEAAFLAGLDAILRGFELAAEP